MYVGLENKLEYFLEDDSCLINLKCLNKFSLKLKIDIRKGIKDNLK